MSTQDAKSAFTPARRIACARCGAPFDCGLSAECWCASIPARLPLPGDAAEDCLCPACLSEATGLSNRDAAGDKE